MKPELAKTALKLLKMMPKNKVPKSVLDAMVEGTPTNPDSLSNPAPQ